MKRVLTFATSAFAVLLFALAARADTQAVSYSFSDKGGDYGKGGDSKSVCDDGCLQKDDSCMQKDDGCGSKCGGCGSCGSCYLFGPEEAWEVWPADNCTGINVGGWVSAGYHSRPTPLSANYDDRLSFNDVPDGVNFHQTWAYIEKVADTECQCWDWGFGADIMYGTDSFKTTAFGAPGTWDTEWTHGVYGWALPQLYGEIAVGNLSVIAGHFYTLAGYEVVTAPDNFFYSHSLTMFNSEPFTHTGALATYGVSDNLEVYGGWTAGWDTGFTTFQGGSNFLGGFSASLCDNLSLTYINTFGDLGWRGNNGYSHSLVFDTAITERLNWVLQSDYLRVEDTQFDTVGINNYLFYTLNDCLKLGSRIEWWRSDVGDYYEWTSGVNIRPAANLVVRPEIRYDWNNNVDPALDDLWTFGIDAILTF